MERHESDGLSPRCGYVVCAGLWAIDIVWLLGGLGVIHVG